MTAELIASLVVLFVVVVVLSVWQAGRAVLIESISHPLRKAAVHVDANGNVKVVPDQAEAEHTHSKPVATH